MMEKDPTPHRDLLGRNASARVSLGCGVSHPLLEPFMALTSLMLGSTGKLLGRAGFREFK